VRPSPSLIAEAIRLALPLVKELEDFRPAWYLCPAGRRTIGYGETDYKGDAITELEAAELLASRLQRIMVHVVTPTIAVRVTACQLAALASWTYNVGPGAFRASTLLRLLNEGDYDAVPGELRRWNKITVAGAKVANVGLTLRREWEIRLWHGDI